MTNLCKMIGVLAKNETPGQKSNFIFWPLGPSFPSGCGGDQFMSGSKKLLMTLDNETLSTKTFNLPASTPVNNSQLQLLTETMRN